MEYRSLFRSIRKREIQASYSRVFRYLQERWWFVKPSSRSPQYSLAMGRRQELDLSSALFIQQMFTGYLWVPLLFCVERSAQRDKVVGNYNALWESTAFNPDQSKGVG